VEGFLPVFFLLVVLKIPVLGAIWLVWWAGRQTPEPEAAGDDDSGFKRFRPEPRSPRGPRRGPHGGGARAMPPCPPGGRTRVLTPPAPARAALGRANGAAHPEREPAGR